MKGAFCVNEWLIEQGDLVLKEAPARGASIEKTPVDWPKTKVWGWGGYYARLFFNVEGREPQGVIKPEDYEKERDAMIERLKAIRGPEGRTLGDAGHQAQRVLRRRPGRLSGPHGLFRRPLLAVGRHARAGGRCISSRTTPARTTPSTPRRGCISSTIRASRVGPAARHRHHRRRPDRPAKLGLPVPSDMKGQDHRMTEVASALPLRREPAFVSKEESVERPMCDRVMNRKA